MIILNLLLGITGLSATVEFSEIRTASNRVIVAFFRSDTVDVNEIDCRDLTAWRINGIQPDSIDKYVMQADQCDHHIYLHTDILKEGMTYLVETPYGNKEFIFREREVYCESIKTNPAGYSALARSRYANFGIWLGTGGAVKIDGELPVYEVFSLPGGETLLTGRLQEVAQWVIWVRISSTWHIIWWAESRV